MRNKIACSGWGKTTEEGGRKVQSPILASGVGIKRQPLGEVVVAMSLYITLISDQAVGTGQKIYRPTSPFTLSGRRRLGSGPGSYLTPWF